MLRHSAHAPLLLLCVSLLMGESPGADFNARGSRSQFLHKILEDYDPRVPPNFNTDDATDVSVNVFISNFDSISETTMDYSVTLFLRMTWEDTRLQYRHLSEEPVLTMDSRVVSSIWVPDLFFSNEKRAHYHEITVPNQYIRIYRNGTIQFSARISLTLSCPMILQKFPLDTQVCSIQFESYAYTTDRLRFTWRPLDPVEMSTSLQLPQFSLDRYGFEDCTKTYSTGSFTCLQINFELRRDIGFFMIQTYVPSALIVILSWVSFWINIDAVPARISLGVLTILTMTTQTTGSQKSQPRVSYVKAIDVWMSTCLFFVFAALLEFAIVNVLSRKEIRRMVTVRRNTLYNNGLPMEDDPTAALSGCVMPRTTAAIKRRHQTDRSEGASHRAAFIADPEGKDKARTVDKIARKLFPASFIIYNAIYWTAYVMWTPAGIKKIT